MNPSGTLAQEKFFERHAPLCKIIWPQYQQLGTSPPPAVCSETEFANTSSVVREHPMCEHKIQPHFSIYFVRLSNRPSIHRPLINPPLCRKMSHNQHIFIWLSLSFPSDFAKRLTNIYTQHNVEFDFVPCVKFIIIDPCTASHSMSRHNFSRSHGNWLLLSPTLFQSYHSLFLSNHSSLMTVRPVIVASDDLSIASLIEQLWWNRGN